MCIVSGLCDKLIMLWHGFATFRLSLSFQAVKVLINRGSNLPRIYGYILLYIRVYGCMKVHLNRCP